MAQQVENVWVSIHPYPVKCIHVNDGEFVGAAFWHMLQRNRITDDPTTSHNPQVNSMRKRLHQTVVDSCQQAVQVVDDDLATTTHAM
eukprot:1243863-Ditylum_brightwellii.AAC.1